MAEKSAYHHGEVSLQETIIKLAQNFVGSNNLNLLVPIGMFGSRLQGGKDHAASRFFLEINLISISVQKYLKTLVLNRPSSFINSEN